MPWFCTNTTHTLVAVASAVDVGVDVNNKIDDDDKREHTEIFCVLLLNSKKH